MAESFAHKWGQVIGNLLRLFLADVLQKVADKHGLYLDYQRRRAILTGENLTWQEVAGDETGGKSSSERHHPQQVPYTIPRRPVGWRIRSHAQ
jgi:hypothetical protein